LFPRTIVVGVVPVMPWHRRFKTGRRAGTACGGFVKFRVGMATATSSTVPLAPFQYYNSERVPSRTIGLHLEISRYEHRADSEREAKPEPEILMRHL